MFKYFSIRRLRRYVFLTLANLPMSGKFRWHFLKWGGVKFELEGKPNIYIGKDVRIDTLTPQNICIENHVHITAGTTILTHYYNPFNKTFNYGSVKIGGGSFIGINTIICNSVVIGKNVTIGAGSVVTKDIPDNEVWAGVPARFIKKVELENQ